VRLSGGLGNQLFQYAAARSMALDTGAELLLDTSSFPTDPQRRRYALERFPLRATRRDLHGWRAGVAAAPGLWRLLRATGGTPRVGGTRFLFDRLRGEDHRLRGAAAETVLIGYWQDEAHFARHAQTLRRELDPSANFAPSTRSLGDDLSATCTLGVHVRRGDFARPDSPHGSASKAYFRAAYRTVSAAAAIDRTVVFSDDPAWASDALPAEARAEVVPRDPDRGDDEDLWLLSRCRHVVTSNSSWSWWAAWLAERPDTLIACPERWYRPVAGPIPHPAPSRWRRIPDDPVA
jgi:hypothetical protein